MPAARPLDLVLLWHMHQPDYRDLASGEFAQPWTYLHAIKDYTDMAAHLERHPGARAVVNFTPVLLEQLEDYAGQFASGRIRDPLLRLLARDEATPLDAQERALVVQQCFRVNHEKMVAPFPAYRRLHELYAPLERADPPALEYLSDRYLYDLVTWYHLGWTGETVRRSSELVPRLMTVGGSFSRAERRALFDLIGELVRSVVSRYARLAAEGRIELSTTPYHHPLAPLLIDFAVAREARHGTVLPEAQGYPGGLGRVQAQIESALASHERRFGARPQGLWPAEGGVSAAFARLAAAAGCRWIASSESVLAASLRKGGAPAQERGRWLYRPYRLEGGPLAAFFRDDRLSDAIGFDYAKWHSRDAALDFVTRLEGIGQAAEGGAPVVSVILDGENCWEHYPYNGYHFLETLYGELEKHPAIRSTTFAACLAETDDPARPRAGAETLARLAPGSWVHGDFSTWIGSRAKNHAWDLLCAAKQAFDLVAGSGRIEPARAQAALRELANCEGSDWFWWFGDYNPAHSVEVFDRLFRGSLARLYRLLELPAPAALGEPLSRGGGHPEADGTMRRAGA
jgi:alpha-amylase/alpha-mannosidase (GH57 family)